MVIILGVLNWELTAIFTGWMPTLSQAIREWGPWPALAYIIFHAVLVWHLWIQKA
jgi:hypothetical protein